MSFSWGWANSENVHLYLIKGIWKLSWPAGLSGCQQTLAVRGVSRYCEEGLWKITESILPNLKHVQFSACVFQHTFPVLFFADSFGALDGDQLSHITPMFGRRGIGV